MTWGDCGGPICSNNSWDKTAEKTQFLWTFTPVKTVLILPFILKDRWPILSNRSYFYHKPQHKKKILHFEFNELTTLISKCAGAPPQDSALLLWTLSNQGANRAVHRLKCFQPKRWVRLQSPLDLALICSWLLHNLFDHLDLDLLPVLQLSISALIGLVGWFVTVTNTTKHLVDLMPWWFLIFPVGWDYWVLFVFERTNVELFWIMKCPNKSLQWFYGMKS